MLLIGAIGFAPRTGFNPNLLELQAHNSGITLEPRNVAVDDGLSPADQEGTTR